MSRRHRGKEPSVVAQLEWELGADWIEQASDRQLIELGSVVAGTDYAVLHYLHDWHGKFFGQRQLLEKAVRRGLERSDISFDRAIFVLRRASGGEAATRADQATLASVEALRGVLLGLSDEDLDCLMREIAYDPGECADMGDDYLSDWGYLVKEKDDNDDDDDLVPVQAQLDETRNLIEGAGTVGILDLAQYITEHARHPAVPKEALSIVTQWPMNVALRSVY